MRTYNRAAGLLLVMAGLGTGACSGDSAHDRTDYVTALAGEEGDGFTEEGSRCAAGAMVDVGGVDALEDAGAFDKIGENPTGSLADFGIEVTETQGSELYAAINECKDMRAFFLETLTNSGVTPELAECMVDDVGEATLEAIIITGFTKGDAAVEADPELSTAFESAATDCAAAGVS